MAGVYADREAADGLWWLFYKAHPLGLFSVWLGVFLQVLHDFMMATNEIYKRFHDFSLDIEQFDSILGDMVQLLKSILALWLI